MNITAARIASKLASNTHKSVKMDKVGFLNIAHMYAYCYNKNSHIFYMCKRCYYAQKCFVFLHADSGFKKTSSRRKRKVSNLNNDVFFSHYYYNKKINENKAKIEKYEAIIKELRFRNK